MKYLGAPAPQCTGATKDSVTLVHLRHASSLHGCVTPAAISAAGSGQIARGAFSEAALASSVSGKANAALAESKRRAVAHGRGAAEHRARVPEADHHTQRVAALALSEAVRRTCVADEERLLHRQLVPAHLDLRPHPAASPSHLRRVDISTISAWALGTRLPGAGAITRTNTLSRCHHYPHKHAGAITRLQARHVLPPARLAQIRPRHSAPSRGAHRHPQHPARKAA